VPRVLLACECSGRVRDEFAKRGWEAWSADILHSETPCHEFTAEGHDYYLDMFPWDDEPYGKHYLGDVRDLFSWSHSVNQYAQMPEHGYPWDLIIAFPPCTDLAYAGAAWFKQKIADGRQQAGADFFMEMINAPAPYVAVENPRGVMFTKYRKPDQTIQPWWFGDPFKKSTCLWLKNLPHLVPTHDEHGTLATVTSGDSKGYKLHKTVTSGSTYDASAAHDFNGRQHYEDSEGRKNRAKVRSRTFRGVAEQFAEQWGSYIERELLTGTS
jgi:hypothetical protein